MLSISETDISAKMNDILCITHLPIIKSDHDDDSKIESGTTCTLNQEDVSTSDDLSDTLKM